MKNHTNVTRLITAGLLAATVLSFASPALADRGGRSRRFKGVQNRHGVERVVVRQRSNSAGPAIAGLIGGFILGSAMSSNAHPVVVHDRRYYAPRPVIEYRYYDPYGDDWYDSLDACEFRHGGPRIIQVIDVRSGREVRRMRYHEGRWNRISGDYDYQDRDFDRRGSRGSDDRRRFDDRGHDSEDSRDDD